jgi:hypothetical protein
MPLLLPVEATKREKKKMREMLNTPMLCDKQRSWGGRGEREGTKEWFSLKNVWRKRGAFKNI